MTIPLNEGRMRYALNRIKGEMKLPPRHPLNLALVLRIAHAMNQLRAENVQFHSALQQAAELEDADTGLKAVARQVVSLYGRLTYKAMKKAGSPTGELAFWRGAFRNGPPQKIGAKVRVARAPADASGQLGFLVERR